VKNQITSKRRKKRGDPAFLHLRERGGAGFGGETRSGSGGGYLKAKRARNTCRRPELEGKIRRKKQKGSLVPRLDKRWYVSRGQQLKYKKVTWAVAGGERLPKIKNDGKNLRKSDRSKKEEEYKERAKRTVEPVVNCLEKRSKTGPPTR